MGRRINIESDNVAQLGDEVWIVRELELSAPVRLEPVRFPDATDRACTYATRPGHQIGLDNVRQRLALMFHGETDLDVVEGPERFIVTLRFPVGGPTA